MATPISGPQTATVGQAITRVKNTEPQRVTFVVEYIRELWRLGSLYGYNPVVLLAQAYHETGSLNGEGPFESDVWKDYGNPAGIGVTDGPNRSLTYTTGTDAARAHLIHMAGYVQGNTGWVADSPFKALDPQWPHLVEHEAFGTIEYVEQLGSGVWATQDSDTYAGSILDYMREIEDSADPVEPVPEPQPGPTPTPVPQPDGPILPPIVWVGSPNYHARGMAPIAICYHITDDLNLNNTISWFNNPNSDASANFTIDRDGTIYQHVNSMNAPWTNGDVNKPRLDIGYIQEMRRRGGNFNNGTITIEHVGKPSVPPTEAQYASSIALTRYFTHPDIYGKTIRKIRGFMIRHADINSVSRPYCPGDDFQLGRIITEAGGDPIVLA